jgi:GGDEF domain-containing protein
MRIMHISVEYGSCRKQADSAMYEAKTIGKRTVAVYQSQ